MDYISYKEFKRQSSKMQVTLLHWWNPEVTDVIYEETESHIGIIKEVICDGLYFRISELEGVSEKEDLTPLLTETQLRKFIEEKTGKKIWIHYNNGYKEGNVTIIDLANDYEELKVKHDTYAGVTDDLLQVYWQVAIKIAEEI